MAGGRPQLEEAHQTTRQLSPGTNMASPWPAARSAVWGASSDRSLWRGVTGRQGKNGEKGTQCWRSCSPQGMALISRIPDQCCCLCSFTFKYRLSRRVKLGNRLSLAGMSPAPSHSLTSQPFTLAGMDTSHCKPPPKRLANPTASPAPSSETTHHTGWMQHPSAKGDQNQSPLPGVPRTCRSSIKQSWYYMLQVQRLKAHGARGPRHSLEEGLAFKMDLLCILSLKLLAGAELGSSPACGCGRPGRRDELLDREHRKAQN